MLLLIYLPRKDERLSWPSWRTCSGRFTHIVVTRQLQAKRRTGSVRWPKTNCQLPTVLRVTPAMTKMRWRAVACSAELWGNIGGESRVTERTQSGSLQPSNKKNLLLDWPWWRDRMLTDRQWYWSATGDDPTASNVNGRNDTDAETDRLRDGQTDRETKQTGHVGRIRHVASPSSPQSFPSWLPLLEM